MLVAASLVAAAAAGTAGAAGGRGAAGEPGPVGVDSHDGASVFRLAFSVRRLMDETIDPAAAASAADGSCGSCVSVAAAVQSVLALTDPGTAVPAPCQVCDTLASTVRGVTGPAGLVRFTDEGNRRLVEARLRLAQLRIADVTPEQLAAEIQAVTGELRDTVATQLAPAAAGDP